MKNNKYILTSSRETLKKKDAQAEKNVETTHLFKETINKYKNNYEKKYNEIIKNNELLFITDYIIHLKTEFTLKFYEPSFDFKSHKGPEQYLNPTEW